MEVVPERPWGLVVGLPNRDAVGAVVRYTRVTLQKAEERARVDIELAQRAAHSILSVEWGTWDPGLLTRRTLQALALPSADNDIQEAPADPPVVRCCPSDLLKSRTKLTELHVDREVEPYRPPLASEKDLLPSCLSIGTCAVDSSAQGRILTISQLEADKRLAINRTYRRSMIEPASHVDFLMNAPPTTLERVDKAQQMLHHLNDSVAVADPLCPPDVSWSKYRFAPGWAEGGYHSTPAPAPLYRKTKGCRPPPPPPTAQTEEEAIHNRLMEMNKKSFLFKSLQAKSEIVSEYDKELRKLQRDHTKGLRYAAAVGVQKITRSHQARQRCARLRQCVAVVQAFGRAMAQGSGVRFSASRMQMLNTHHSLARRIQKALRGGLARCALSGALHRRVLERSKLEGCGVIQSVGRGALARRFVGTVLYLGRAALKIQCAFRCGQARSRRTFLKTAKALSEVAAYKKKIFLVDMRVLETNERRGLMSESGEVLAGVVKAFAVRHAGVSKMLLHSSVAAGLPKADLCGAEEQVTRCDVLQEELLARHVLLDAMLELRWVLRVLPPEVERQKQVCEYRRLEELEAALIHADRKRRLLDITSMADYPSGAGHHAWGPAQTQAAAAAIAAAACMGCIVSEAGTAAYREALQNYPDSVCGLVRTEEEAAFEASAAAYAARTVQSHYKEAASERASGISASQDMGLAYRRGFAANEIQRVYRGYIGRLGFADRAEDMRMNRELVLSEQRARARAAIKLSQWCITHVLYRAHVPQPECDIEEASMERHLHHKMDSLQRKDLFLEEKAQRHALRNDYDHFVADEAVPAQKEIERLHQQGLQGGAP